MGKYLSWLGVLAGAVSVFRLLHLAIAFDLSKPATLVLDFYETFFHPIADFFKPIVRPLALPLAHALGLNDLPPWWREVFIVYALIGAALFRHSIEHPDAVDPEASPFRARYRRARENFQRDRGVRTPEDKRQEHEPKQSLSQRILALGRAAGFAIFWPAFPLFLFTFGFLQGFMYLLRARRFESEAAHERSATQSGDEDSDETKHGPPLTTEIRIWINRHLYLWSLEMLKVLAASVVFMISNAAANSYAPLVGSIVA